MTQQHASLWHALTHPSSGLIAIYLIAAGAILSVSLQSFVDVLRARRLAEQQSAGYKTLKLQGTWHAVWQAYVAGTEILNTETVEVRQRRNHLMMRNTERSAENPEGGYLWLGHGTVFDNQYFLGSYVAREPNVRSKGVLYLSLHNSGRIMEGQWVGCSFDGDLATGRTVFAREADEAQRRMPALLAGKKKGRK